MDIEKKLIAFIFKAHDGQFDISGAHYALHPIAVMQLILKHVPSASMDLLIAALGHDLKDDTLVTVDEMIAVGFSKRSIDLIEGVSNSLIPNVFTYQGKIQRLVNSGDIELLVLKLFDNVHNLNPERGCSEKQKSLRKRYLRSSRIIIKALNDLKVDFELPAYVVDQLLINSRTAGE